MHWHRAKLPPGGTNHELLWLSVSLACAALGGLWVMLSLPLPRCPLRLATGIPCLACGATRCLAALLSGELRRALAINPLAAGVVWAAALYDLYAFGVLLGWWKRIVIAEVTRREARLVRSACFSIVFVSWAYLVLTLEQ